MTCSRSWRCSRTGTSAGRGSDGGWGRGVRGNYRVAVQIKTSWRDKSHGRILVFKWDSHAVDGQRVVVVFVAMVVSRNVSLHRGDVCDILHAKRKRKRSRGTPLCSQTHAIEWIATVFIFFIFFKGKHFLLCYSIVDPLVCQSNNGPPANKVKI